MTDLEERAEMLCREAYDRFVMGGWEPKDLYGFARNAFQEIYVDVAADECASCQKIMEVIADVLHNLTTDRSAAQAYLNEKPIYGVVGDMEMRAAAKALRSVAASLRVREIKIREGKL